MGREAVENIAERMCRRAERQQGAKSFNLSNLKKDFDACGLPVDDSQGRSQEQKVRIVTGLILRLQTEANSGIADRPLGHGFCVLMKKSESTIAEGMQQLLDEVNGHVASEPISGGKKAVLNLANRGADGQAAISKAPLSNSGPVSDIIENLDAAEALINTAESDPYGFNEQRAAQAKGYLDEAVARCETIRDRAQRQELLGRHRNMGLRLQKIAEQKGEIVQKKVKELFDKARTTMDFFSGHPGQDEIAEVDALFEQARIELKALSGSHYDTVRAGLRSQFNELKEKLQPYKGNISDSQQTTATNSEVNQRIELVSSHPKTIALGPRSLQRFDVL
ncbi:hypothetical protein [Endozoicomonas sp. SCSIO W0465]|uniref:hypothetical protein n=1 Tax=Endozoicomonas sp. SCSIO W0465 TaxID=2918516 RepID=UPI002074AE7D|nr:hypothetical protein [Endozoicomonas sp. SCSIO W0465]USE38504.1 hypothetical protein MJO57_10240 [Endozoicomonas sp. SCSIO W0465]